jgi:hypothetical protein
MHLPTKINIFHTNFSVNLMIFSIKHLWEGAL